MQAFTCADVNPKSFRNLKEKTKCLIAFCRYITLLQKVYCVEAVSSS